MQTSTTSTIKTYKGIKIYPTSNGWKMFLDSDVSTTTKTLRGAKELITNALSSWATALDGNLVPTQGK